MESRRPRVTSILITSSIALFVLCLATDGYYIEGSEPRAWSPGLGLLLLGWMGIGSGGTAWLANPLLFLGWILFFFKQPVFSLLCSVGAIALMFSFLFVDFVIASEAPTYARVIGYGIGYWLWIASAASLLVAAFWRAGDITIPSTDQRAP